MPSDCQSLDAACSMMPQAGRAGQDRTGQDRQAAAPRPAMPSALTARKETVQRAQGAAADCSTPAKQVTSSINVSPNLGGAHGHSSL